MRYGIVGGRKYPEIKKVETYVRGLKPLAIVSGGAVGVDQAAEWICMYLGGSTISYRPVEYPEDSGRFRIVKFEFAGTENLGEQWYGQEFKSYGQACFVRNTMIVADSSKVVAFWDGVSKGTRHSIDLALKQGKNLEVIFPNE